MSGRRLLDAAAVLKASRNVAKKHAAIRRKELDNYGKTSSLVHAIKSQTDRVILTVTAASALAQRFNGTRQESSPQATGDNDGRVSSTVPTQEERSGDSNKARREEGMEQDHSYDESFANTVAEPAKESSLNLQQARAKTRHVADRTIPPTGTTEGKPARYAGYIDQFLGPPADQAQEIQRQLEERIPIQVAKPPQVASVSS